MCELKNSKTCFLLKVKILILQITEEDFFLNFIYIAGHSADSVAMMYKMMSIIFCNIFINIVAQSFRFLYTFCINSIYIVHLKRLCNDIDKDVTKNNGHHFVCAAFSYLDNLIFISFLVGKIPLDFILYIQRKRLKIQNLLNGKI
jgi:hypothetical protein